MTLENESLEYCLQKMNSEYEHKVVYLEALVRQATGIDISALPSDIVSSLSILARTALALNLDDPSVPAYASAFNKLSSEHLEVQQELIHLETTQKDLIRAIDVARYEQARLGSWLSSIERLQNETSDFERQKKAMNAKAKEYQEELASIMRNSPAVQAECPSITSLFALQDSIQDKERELRALRERLKTFQDLPPHVELAKQQLQTARDNQIRLMNIREKLLGKMNVGLS